MAAPGRMAKAKQPESLNGRQEIAEFLGQPFVRSPTLGKIQDASHPPRSAGARIAGGTESLAWTRIRWGARSDRYRNG
jgi:hypothetical protein